MQNKKLLMGGIGALAVIAVAGVAITFNQGGLFKGSLSDLPVDYTAELAASGQNMDARYLQTTATNGKKYTLFGDKKLLDSQSVAVEKDLLVFNKDNLKAAGYDDVFYMKWIEAATQVTDEVMPAADSPYAKATRMESVEMAPVQTEEMTTTIRTRKAIPLTQPVEAVAADSVALSTDQMDYLRSLAVPVARAQDASVNPDSVIKNSLDKSLVFRMEKLGELADGNYTVVTYAGKEPFARFAIKMVSNPTRAVAKCTTVDRIAFTPSSITYQEGGSVSFNADLSAYVGETNVGLPMDNNQFCADTWEKLNLEANMPGLAIEIIESGGTVVASDMIMFQDGVGPTGYSLFNGFLNIGLVDAGGKAVMRFTNDFSKKDSMANGLQFGKQYMLNLRGTKLKNPNEPKSLLNMAPLDKVAARYSLNLSSKAAPVTTATTTTTTTTRPVTTTTQVTTTETVVTKPSAQPCIVDGKTFYLAQGPDSAYCKDLQALGDTFKADQAPETPQVRYTTALASQRILSDIIESQNLDARFRIKNLPAQWYTDLRDSNVVAAASAQEQTDFKSVYAAGVLTGRIDINTGDITLAPLERIKYIELFSLLKQTFDSVIGYTAEVADSRMPAFALEYRNDANKVWMYEAIAFAIEFDIITKDEFTATTIQGLAQRADLAKYLNKFKSAIEKDPTLLEN